jgi:hypothetical protein
VILVAVREDDGADVALVVSQETARMSLSWSRRYEKSGRTRSTPRCSSRGNDRPASMTTMPSSLSTTIMFFPTSPSPPSGISRVEPATG